jgi:serine/threonine protein kinase
MISFSCSRCGMKLKVKDEFTGRSSKCPTCKQPLVVPAPDQTVAGVAAGEIEGTSSSLAQAGVDGGGITLDHGASAARAGQRSVQELLAQRTKKDGRYLLEHEIARGGMGVVLRAVDCDIRREVAVKYLLDQTNAGKKLRFVEEAQITGQLEHPNIVPIHELGVDALKRVFFSMKMVKGRSLAQVLDELRQQPKQVEKEWSLGRLLNVLVNVCNALAYAHSCGVVHRDLKPANIMIGDFGEVYVMDWGLAKVLKGGQIKQPAPMATVVSGVAAAAPAAAPAAVPLGQSISTKRSSKVETSRNVDADLTQEGAVLGTPVYMPPEQATGKVEAIDQRSDVYSLGAILYEMLTLQPPVDKEDGYLAILMRVVQGEIIPPERATHRVIPKELSAIAMKALAKKPQDRYSTVEALRKDIERFQEGRSVSAKLDTTREMLVKFVKRNKAFSATAIVALTVLLVVLGFTFSNYLDLLKQRERTRQAVPAFLRASQLAVNDRQFKDALDQATVAVDYDPNNADAHLFKGKLLIVQQQFSQARLELEKYQKQRPGDGAADKLLKLCREAKPSDATTCLAFAEFFTKQKEYGLADGTMRGFGANTVDARNKLFQMYRQRIEERWPSLGNRLAVDSAGKFTLNLGGSDQVTDLSPLRGMSLTSLDLSQCRQVRDLSPLRGMPLTSLNLTECGQVRDLSPLHDMPLTSLNLTFCGQVGDLASLQGLPLVSLSIRGCGQVRDLSPLRGMKLTSLNLAYCSQISSLSPLHHMPLTSLDLYDCREVHDLTPLQGMPLASLVLYRCRRITDLSPLKGMPLTSLYLEGCSELKHLTPLQGMKLTTLNLVSCRGVQDLTPLRGMPLTSLDITGCGARDLSPLQGLPLTELGFEPKIITQGISVLRGMTMLKSISVGGDRREKLTPEQFWKKYDAGDFTK